MAQCGDTLVGIGSMTETALKSWGLQRSIDGGEHWNEFSRGMLFSDGDFSLLRPDRFVFASRDGRVLESRDWGTGWRDVSPHAEATWASAFYTFDRDAQTDLLVLYDPTRYGVLIDDALRPGRYWRQRNQSLYVGKFVKSGASCRANANGATYYVVQNGKLWIGRASRARTGPTLESARCAPAALALNGEGQSFTVSATVSHPKGAAALKQVSLDFSIAGGDAAVPLFDDGQHEDGAAGDGKWAGKIVVPQPLTWKIPPEDRRYPWGTKVFTLTAVDNEGKKSTLPVVINLYQPPQPLILFDGGACFGNFGCRDDQHSFGLIDAQIKDKAGIDGKRALVIAAKDDKPWRTTWGTVYRGTFINVAGYGALAFRVKGTVSADLCVSLMDCFVEKEDEQIDDFNFTRAIGVISGGYLKAINAEYQEVVVPLAELLPPGYHFIRKRTIGMAFSMAEGGKAGTFMLDKIQLRP